MGRSSVCGGILVGGDGVHGWIWMAGRDNAWWCWCLLVQFVWKKQDVYGMRFMKMLLSIAVVKLDLKT